MGKRAPTAAAAAMPSAAGISAAALMKEAVKLEASSEFHEVRRDVGV